MYEAPFDSDVKRMSTLYVRKSDECVLSLSSALEPRPTRS
mgnify:CR=1 FL=1